MLAALLYRSFRDRKRRQQENLIQATASKTTNVKRRENPDNPSKQRTGISEGPGSKMVNKRRRNCSMNSLHRKPSWVEVFCVLGMVFGIPLSFLLYKRVMSLMNMSPENVTYTFVARDLDVARVESILHENRRRFEYKYNNLMSIDRRKNLSMDEFQSVYNGKWPVIITDCVPKWKAFTKWNVDYFRKHYGKDIVSMKTVMGTLDQAQHMAMKLERFVGQLDEGYPLSWTYLEDELFLLNHKELLSHLGECDYLKEDYFTLFPEEVRPWWASLLWGTRFSRSSLHIDPYNWTGTNAVISGLKRWKLYPPGQDALLYVKTEKYSAFPISCLKYNSKVDAFDSNSVRQHPLLREAKWMEFYQYPGELLIIPPGWFHQAFNEQPTLAVSGQLMNRANYRIVLEEMFKAKSFSREGYDAELGKWPAQEQVKAVIARVDGEMRKKGRESSVNVVNQMLATKQHVEEL